MIVTVKDIQEKGVGHYAKGAVKFIASQFLPETVASRKRVETCINCPFYSENSRNAYKGHNVCTLCTCPILEKSKRADVDKNEVCPMGYW